MNIEKMREQFEAWADSEGYVMDSIWGVDGHHGYEDEDTQYAWGLFKFSWQASRAALSIELPVFDDYAASIDAEMRDSLRDAIESAGLKVKS